MIPFAQTKTVVMEQLEKKDRFFWLLSSVVPRPIAWISTRSSVGINNISPYSFYGACSGNPPCVMFGATYRADGLPKDTLRNAEETGEFVVNFSTEGNEEVINQTSGEFPPEVDEFERFGLTPVASQIVKAPRVLQSPLSMECKVKKSIELDGRKAGATIVVIGEVVAIHVDPKVIDPATQLPDPKKLSPITRLGGPNWAKMGDLFQLTRPK